MALSKRTQLDSRIARAAHAVESASVMRSHAAIRSPFAGVVTEKRAEPGQMATPGTPLLTVEQTGAYRLEAPVHESMLGTVRQGQTVSVVLDAANQTVTGRVTEIVPVVDPQSRAFLVKVTLPPSPLLRTGLFGRMRVQRGVSHALTVPAGAIVSRGSLQSVFTIDNESARMRMITAGDSRDGHVQILSGLQAGERIVYPRPANLSDGARVEVRQ
jgi:RND family efflux transporter MFP subunit